MRQTHPTDCVTAVHGRPHMKDRCAPLLSRRLALLFVVGRFVATGGGYVTVKTTNPEGGVTVEYAKDCTVLAPGVSLCEEIEVGGKDVTLQVINEFVPDRCRNKIGKGSYIRLHHVGKIDNTSAVGNKGEVFEVSQDFTRSVTYLVGVGSAIRGWDIALVGMCLGQKTTVVVPPELGFAEGNTNVPLPHLVGATLRYELEVMIIMEADPTTGKQLPPNLFKLMDSDGSNSLDEREVLAHFERIKQKLPSPTLFFEQDAGDAKPPRLRRSCATAVHWPSNALLSECASRDAN